MTNINNLYKDNVNIFVSQLFDGKDIDSFDEKVETYTEALLFFNYSNPKEELLKRLSNPEHMFDNETKKCISELDNKKLLYYSDFNTNKANLTSEVRHKAPYTYRLILSRIQFILNIHKGNIEDKFKFMSYHILQTRHSFSDIEEDYLKKVIASIKA